jgi:hypothetical protein
VTHEIPQDNSLAEIKPGAAGMKEGLNFISFQLEPTDSSSSAILAPVIDKLEVAWGKNEQGDWIFFRPGFPFNTMTNMHSSEGYLLTLTEEASLRVEGAFHSDPIALREGLNIVGYRSIESHHILDTIDNISGSLDVIWGKNEENQWIFYRPGFPFNSLNEIVPGKSFLIYTVSSCDW